MAKGLEGYVLLTVEEFPGDLSKVSGGLAGDIIIEKSSNKGYFFACASFKKIKIGDDGCKKIKQVLVKLTGVDWKYDKQCLFRSAPFTRKEFVVSSDNSPVQKELPLNIKKTALGRACDKVCNLIAKKKKAQYEIAAMMQDVLREMEKAGKNTVVVDSQEFYIKTTPENKTVCMRGKG